MTTQIKARPTLDLIDIDDEISNKIQILKDQNKDNEIFQDSINILILFKEAKEQIEPIITVNIDDLELGKYQNDKSKSDKNITDSIKFFTNNLKSFKQFKESKSLEWIIRNRRLLLLEFIQYYIKKDLKLLTFKSRLNAIMRIYCISYDDNKDFTTYNQLGKILDNISINDKIKEGENKRDEREEQNHLDFRIILQRRQELENDYNAYSNKKNQQAFNKNQDLVLISLYTLIPPSRRELFNLKFTKTDQKGVEDDYIYIKEDGNLIIQLNKEVKRHESKEIDVKKESELLNEILLNSFIEYPRDNVFIIKKQYPAMIPIKMNGLSVRIPLIFEKYGKNVNINSLRSSYISNALKNPKITYNDKLKISKSMRTGLKYIESSYKKIDDEIIEIPKIDEVKPPKLNSIELSKASYKRYYEKSKEQIALKQKEYRDKVKIPSYRPKLLLKLNIDPNYILKTSQDILTKYNIVKDERGIYK